ncbi:tetratricopeptide repeat protein [Leptospira fluminis]|uniref:Tetratricopeptide repeat protein n=1 Tax=Leptospira fluminis TaxID=2484979 RepID=A0A4V6QKU2_9LEPT|nr:tetratricopeptide repeat protein [Leptospira fluminis]TGK17844.1 tetratricopeptide repeat protein [Leptospira fluminis]
MENHLMLRKDSIKKRVWISVVVPIFCFATLGNCGPDEKKLDEKYGRAQALFGANKRAEATKLLKEIYEAKSDFKDIAFVLGKAYYYDLKFQDAIRCFQDASSKDRENLVPLLWVIKSQFAAGIRDKSIFENIQSYVKRDAGNIELLFMNGRLLEEAGKTDQAIQSYNQIVMQTLPLALAHKRLAEIYKKANIPAKADFHRRKFENLRGND